ncbi:kappaPI-actitoxin-Avd3c [Anabrus simplex]|uniref:kappaPI-actitoxin-Avd3c n=1 Tax=Anabrus simplex TaxID=316456 RepID=UPI0035A3CC7E
MERKTAVALVFLSTIAVSMATKVQPELCLLPYDVGPCRAGMPRYYYNAATNICERFTYGGCRGNENNFRTPKECVETCMPNDGEGEYEVDF